MDETLVSRRSELKRKILPLEWDKKLKQINDAREIELKAYIVELDNIEKIISGGTDGKII